MERENKNGAADAKKQRVRDSLKKRADDRYNHPELTPEQRVILNKKRAERREQEEVRRETNREIKVILALLAIGFVLTMCYVCFFVTKRADTFRNSGYNAKRLELLAQRFDRGDITTQDGVVVATTLTDDGEKVRYYPQECTYTHVVGNTVNGVSGLEASAGSYLLDSHENIVTQIMNEIMDRKTVGDTVRSTLDSRLQTIAHDELGNRKGAVVVMEPSSGKVLAMVSKTDYDPNELKYILDDLEDGALVNRVTQGLYTPGSTFKVLTLLEYMRENPNSYQNFTFNCTGEYEVDGNVIHCYKGTKHGEQTLTEAFANSCNGAFAKMGQELNFSKFAETCEQIGFNHSIPGVSMAKSSFTLTNSNSIWKVLQTSIGQGDTQITPMLNCMLAAAIANNGEMMKPRLIDGIYSHGGIRVSSGSSASAGQIVTSSEAKILSEFMRACCESGTGRSAEGEGYTAYGKTGSAETKSDKETNAWFMGYAVADSDPSQKLAVCVIVEEGGSGGSEAAPIAGEIFRAAFGE